MTSIVRLPMPEGGEERNVAFYRHHRCKNSSAFAKSLENPNVDRLQFSVGLFGEGMPTNTPFPVNSTNPCDVCGQYVTLWFEWSGPRFWIP